MRSILLIGAIVLASVSAHAETTKKTFEVKTTKDLYDLCTVGRTHKFSKEAASFCLGYIDGALDFHATVAKNPRVGAIVCPPPTTPRVDVVLTFVKWAQANPKDMKAAPLDTVFRAVADKWPCPKAKRR